MPEFPHPTHGPKGERPYTMDKDVLEFLRTPAGMNFPNSEPANVTSYDPAKKYHTKLDADRIGPAVLAATKQVFHYAENRLLTVREIAARQTFPNEYKFYGTRKEQIKQIGNAVPVEFSRAIARTIREALHDYYAFELEGGNQQDENGLAIDVYGEDQLGGETVHEEEEEEDEDMEAIEVFTDHANVSDSLETSGENPDHGIIKNDVESMEVIEENGDVTDNTESIEVKEDMLYKTEENRNYCEVEEKKEDANDDLKLNDGGDDPMGDNNATTDNDEDDDEVEIVEVVAAPPPQIAESVKHDGNDDDDDESMGDDKETSFVKVPPPEEMETADAISELNELNIREDNTDSSFPTDTSVNHEKTRTENVAKMEQPANSASEGKDDKSWFNIHSRNKRIKIKPENKEEIIEL